MSDFMPAPKNGSRFEFRTIAEMISAFEHLKRVLMGVMLEPRNSKRPLFGRIFQPLIDALRDTDMNTRLDFYLTYRLHCTKVQPYGNGMEQALQQ